MIVKRSITCPKRAEVNVTRYYPSLVTHWGLNQGSIAGGELSTLLAR